MDFDTIRNHYGILIVLSTFISRIIFNGFCWSYGTVIVQLKKQHLNISDTELSLIGSIGQSFGGLLAPLILFLARRYGYQLTFICSLLTCVISLFISSLIHNLHWLLITYSLPYGFANAAIFILGTLICGHYYPVNQHIKHISIMCIISTGFPIGYHIMSAWVFSSIEKNEWQIMKRHLAFIELIATCILGPIFTMKYSSNIPLEYQRPSITVTQNNNNRKSRFSLPIIVWLIGIFTTMSAVNNFLLHLESYLKYLGFASARADLWFRLHGLFDALFRLSIPLFIHLYPVNIIYLFPTCVFTGFIFLLLVFGLLYTSINALAILPIVLFSFTSAVTTSLQYTVSNQLFDKDETEQGYIYHVIITSLGLILGPIIGGSFLDLTGNYKSIMLISLMFLLISFISFSLTILLSNKKEDTHQSEQN
ncbi:unnamed protein product [Adineta steineri]|uniref:Major facilitator superfamily (MFS) profile domain-containing protein n=1 Tax=Adineta steineri TaxID=433720 RepID=A0A815L070_9BILA|nr:unnamed protein product [Adineta steineri]CAF1614151.1 unnamed protein product [Adineta steineri]